ncbi:MAG: hypothetical protein QXP81_01465 [Nitrososphaerota archaeon]
MRRALVLALIFLMLALSLPALAQNTYRVDVTAEPAECVAQITGQGTYQEGADVTVAVVPRPECVMRRWEVTMMGTTSSFEATDNRLYLKVLSDVSVKAILEKFFTPERPLVKILVIANVTGIENRLPKPVYAIKGTTVTLSVEKEIFVGEDKYVFLYWKRGDEVYSEPTIRVVAETDAVFVAHFYRYRRFLDTYYPISEFVELKPETVVEGDRVGRIVAVQVEGMKEPLKLPTMVPRVALRLVSPVYEWYAKVYLDLVSPEPVDALINGNRMTLRPGRNELLFRENETVSMAAIVPRTLKVVQQAPGTLIAKPGYVTRMVYEEKPHAFLLRDLPAPISELAFSFADFSEGLFMLGWPLSTVVMLGFVSVGIAGAAFGVVRTLRALSSVGSGSRIDPEAVIEASVLDLYVRRTASGPFVRTASGIRVPERLREVVEAFKKAKPAEIASGTETERAEVPERRIPEEAKAFLEKKEGKFPAFVLCYTDPDPSALNGRVEFTPELGPLGFEAEASVMAERLSRGATLVRVFAWDADLARQVFLEACRRAGINGDLIEDQGSALKEVRRRRLRAVMLINPRNELVRSLISSGISVVAVGTAYDSNALRIEAGRDGYLGIAAAVMASEGLLNRCSKPALRALAILAEGFGGLAYIREAARLMKEENLSLKDAVYELTGARLRRYMSDVEWRALEVLLRDGPERARKFFVDYARQVGATASWAAFAAKVSAVNEALEVIEKEIEPTSPAPVERAEEVKREEGAIGGKVSETMAGKPAEPESPEPLPAVESVAKPEEAIEVGKPEVTEEVRPQRREEVLVLAEALRELMTSVAENVRRTAGSGTGPAPAREPEGAERLESMSLGEKIDYLDSLLKGEVGRVRHVVRAVKAAYEFALKGDPDYLEFLEENAEKVLRDGVPELPDALAWLVQDAADALEGLGKDREASMLRSLLRTVTDQVREEGKGVRAA